MAANLGLTSSASLRETLERAIAETDAEDDKSLSPQERAMILNVLGFGETRVAEVMIPRADIVAIEENEPVAALLGVYAKFKHSRVPVFRASLDNPVGMVHIKDAMIWAATGEGLPDASLEAETHADAAPLAGLSDVDLNKSIAEAKLVRDALFVPPSMPALTLLAKMKSSQIHLALVVDEFGGTDGLVTFEDLVEEIIGDVSDEHDLGKLPSIGFENEAFVASARTPIEDVEQVLGLSLTAGGRPEDVDTLGGLILATVGSFPKRGQIIPHPAGVTFEILETGPRRLHTIRIFKQRSIAVPETPLTPPASGPKDADSSESSGSAALRASKAA